MVIKLNNNEVIKVNNSSNSSCKEVTEVMKRPKSSNQLPLTIN